MKEKVTTPSADLKARIAVLEVRRMEEGILLKEQLMTTYESLKPLNLIKSTLTGLLSSPGLKGDLFDTALSVGAGHLSKRILVGSTPGPLRDLVGTVAQMAVTGFVSKNTDHLRSGLSHLMQVLFNKRDAEQ